MYRAEQLSHNWGASEWAKNSVTKVNALAGLRVDSCTRLFHVYAVETDLARYLCPDDL